MFAALTVIITDIIDSRQALQFQIVIQQVAWIIIFKWLHVLCSLPIGTSLSYDIMNCFECRICDPYNSKTQEWNLFSFPNWFMCLVVHRQGLTQSKLWKFKERHFLKCSVEGKIWTILSCQFCFVFLFCDYISNFNGTVCISVVVE